MAKALLVAFIATVLSTVSLAEVAALDSESGTGQGLAQNGQGAHSRALHGEEYGKKKFHHGGGHDYKRKYGDGYEKQPKGYKNKHHGGREYNRKYHGKGRQDRDWSSGRRLTGQVPHSRDLSGAPEDGKEGYSSKKNKGGDWKNDGMKKDDWENEDWEGDEAEDGEDKYKKEEYRGKGYNKRKNGGGYDGKYKKKDHGRNKKRSQWGEGK